MHELIRWNWSISSNFIYLLALTDQFIYQHSTLNIFINITSISLSNDSFYSSQWADFNDISIDRMIVNIDVSIWSIYLAAIRWNQLISLILSTIRYQFHWSILISVLKWNQFQHQFHLFTSIQNWITSSISSQFHCWISHFIFLNELIIMIYLLIEWF